MSKAAELAALIGSQSALSNRNIIINGAMQVWQRGTTIDSISSGNYLCDRWRINHSGTDGNVDVDRSTDLPSGEGFGYSQKISMDASESSLDAADKLVIQQKFEGQNLQLLAKGTSGAKKTTVSFFVKSSVASTYTVELVDNDNTRQLSKSYTINSANTWERKTLTFEGDTSGSLDTDANTSMTLNIYIDTGTDHTSGTFNDSAWASTDDTKRVFNTTGWLESTSPEFYITGVQWELGEQATPFEHRSYADELRRCQRYYYKITPGDTGGVGTGIHNATSQATIFIPYQVAMREGPTAVETSSTATDFDIRNNNGIIQLDSVPVFQSATRHGAEVLCNHSGSPTQGEATTLRFRTTSDFIAWSAEL